LPGHLSLKELLSKARRRELAHLIADKSVLSAAIVMGGLVVLLLTGTQVLEWYWLLPLGAVSLGVGLYRLRASMPSLYELAQRIDQRLKLSDALSTALYFSDHPQGDRQAVCDLQRSKAEETAREIDPREAVPSVRPRYVLPVAGLAVAAVALFGVRYLVTGSMNLQPSLLKIAYDSFFATKPAEAKNLPPRARFDPRAGSSPADNPLLDSESPPEDLNSPQNPNGSAEPGEDKTPGQNPAEASEEALDKGKQDQAQGDQSNQGKNGSDQNQKEGDNSKEGDKNGGQDSKGGNSKDSSMMDKLRDALANMMNKMKSSSEGEKSAKNTQKGQPGDKQEPGQKGEQAKDNQQSQADLNGDTQSQGDQQKDANDAQNSDKAAKQAAQDAKNGIGSQEKALKEAQELQAMGKISEILGKRSQNITGEVMMEVGSSKQTLKTAWSSQQATHAEAGGEIHRDEVPLAYQQFVEKYFEEVRRGEPATAGAKPAPKADKTSKPTP